MSAYQTETRTVDGRTFRVEWFYDADHGAPQTEADGHGITEEFRDDPTEFDPEDVSLEDAVRFTMMRRLSKGGRHWRGEVMYYDMWGSLAKAKAEGWGVANPVGLTPDERAMEAVEADYEYLKGWYNDDWHWCDIQITVIEDGEDTDWTSSLWGLQSTDTNYHETVIVELLANAISDQAEAARKTLHENQLELSL